MITGPKYKIAKRLGAPIFEKTQTQKYALHLERKGKRGFTKPKSEFGTQMNEKQKARFTYGLGERQFSNYVKAAMSKQTGSPSQNIFEALETRLDNVIYRVGLAPTRSAARQMVSHGHIAVNSKKVRTPSAHMKVGDKISINGRSVGKPLFANVETRAKDITVPAWLQFDSGKLTAQVQGVPLLSKSENMFDLNTVVEFYSR